jgi:drug/metabolite transporter (DMT)-like permease
VKDKTGSFLPKAALLAATIIWGSSFFIMKETVESIQPTLLLAIRFSVAFVIMAVVFAKRLKKLDRGHLIAGCSAGVFLFLAYTLQTYGLKGTTPGKNAFLTAVYCVIVPFLYWPIEKKRPGADNILSALLCITGIGLIAVDFSEGFSVGYGDILTLAGGLMYAFHMIVLSKGSAGRDPFIITTVQFGSVALLCFISTLVLDGAPRLPQLGVGEITSLAYLAVMCTCVALLMQSWGQKYTHPSSASIILSLESVFGALFSAVFYHEKPSAQVICGFITVFASVLLSETAPIKRLRSRGEQGGAFDE